MIFITLFILNTMPISASGGILLTEDSKAHDIFGNIYVGNFSLLPWQINNAYFGMVGDFLYKKSYPYSNDYMQNPGLHTKLMSFGSGPVAAVQFSKVVGVGMIVKINYVWITYPEAGNNSSVNHTTDGHLASGIELYGNITPISIKGIDFGVQMCLHITAYGQDYYYYEEYDVFDNLTISGIALKLAIGKW